MYKRILSIVLLLTFAAVCSAAGWDLYSDSWVATDALDRTLPDYNDCGAPKYDKYVGLFYFIWMGEHGTDYGPFDVTKILAANPSNPQWGPEDTWHFWGEPEAGYYLSLDPWVMRRNISMIADAGVDFVAFDVTNGWEY